MSNIPIFGKSNPFAKWFRFGRLNDASVADDIEKHNNSVGYSQEQIDLGMGSYYNQGVADAGYGISSVNVQFEQYFMEKSYRIFKYREMSYYPDINDGLDMICDEAIVENQNGEYVSFSLTEEVPEHVEDKLKEYWDYFINDVLQFKETGWDLFRRWLVDGELYLELVLDDEGTDIIDFKILPSHTMSPIYDDNEIVGFVQTPYASVGTHDSGAQDKMEDYASSYSGVVNSGEDDEERIRDRVFFDKDQVLYINYGFTGRNKLDIRGFLESNIRIYNQLKYLEDAVVVYRIVRAPERRIWNVGVGRMTKGKAEQYIRNLVQRYRKNIYYDPSTGAMDASRNFQAMTEDFWFAKDENGEGTTVETLAGGQNLGEMEDIYYFERKLHQNMKIPSNRWSNHSNGADIYVSGKGGEVTRDEIRFSRFINRNQKKFAHILMHGFITLLRVAGEDERYIDENLFSIKLTESNLWKQYKEMELLEARFSILGAIDSYIYRPQENENAPFSMEFVLKKWFMMTTEEYTQNEALLKNEKEIARLMFPQGMTGEGGEDGFGGDMGGGEPFGGAPGTGSFGGGMDDAGFVDDGDMDGGSGDDFGSADGDVGEFDA